MTSLKVNSMGNKECFIKVVQPAIWFMVTIAFDGRRLSIQGSGRGCIGQISGELRKLIDDKPCILRFSVADVVKLCDIWDRWHLNDLRAGTQRQEDALRKYYETNPQKHSYDEACEYLSGVGLLVDNGYKYGSSWLTEEVPQDVIRWLFSLPGDGNSADDVYPPEISEQAFLDVLLV